MIAIQNLLRKSSSLKCFRRLYSQTHATAKRKPDEKADPSLIRNIGILAHIDAGKTTTTERMLFFSGTIQTMGEVHHGNTVTDFMDQERERGITITSAFVSFPWKKHNINLLDTPGHIDFTMEVEQTLSVMDGAVIILDGTAGVEAQTLTVWRQADRYKIPRLIYINKMDRPDAGFFQSVRSLETKFNTKALVLQVPFYSTSKNFRGVIDLVNMECYDWDSKTQGTRFLRKKLSEADGKVWESAMKSRRILTETLSNLDDTVAELIINEKYTFDGMPSEEIMKSVKKVTQSYSGVPVFCGSSFKNIGVQLLMDGVVHFLPSPLSKRSSIFKECFGDDLCAKVFKIRHDKHMGAITFLRIYSGSVAKGQKLYNTRNSVMEKCGRIMVAYADDYEECNIVTMGNVAAVVGLQHTRVGDLMTSNANSVQNARKLLEKKNLSKRDEAKEILTTEALIPDPVFFCSIEPPSSTLQGNLDKALLELSREDPSLKVTYREDNQTVLAGMGELHLEVIKERIRKEYKVDVDTGPLQIAYKEQLIKEERDSHTTDCVIGKVTHNVRITMSLIKKKEESDEILVLDKSPDSIPNISAIFPKHLVAVKNGVESALSCGPKLYCPVINVQVMLHWLEVGRGTAESIISSAASQCVRKLLKAGGTTLLEPLMFVEVSCPSEIMPEVLIDMGKRRSSILMTDMRGDDRVVEALIPLSELLGYATELRILTSGQGSFTMEFCKYAEMSPEAEREAVKSVTGFYPN